MSNMRRYGGDGRTPATPPAWEVQLKASSVPLDTSTIHPAATYDSRGHDAGPQQSFSFNVTYPNATLPMDPVFSYQAPDASICNIRAGEPPHRPKTGGQSSSQAPSKKKMCAICNSGKKHLFTDRNAIGRPQPSGEVETSKNHFEFEQERRLKNHIEDYHLAFLTEEISGRFVCCFCPCNGRSSNDCTVSFQDMEEFLSHICDEHAQPSVWHKPYQHPCKPDPEPAQPSTVSTSLSGLPTSSLHSTLPTSAYQSSAAQSGQHSQWGAPNPASAHFSRGNGSA